MPDDRKSSDRKPTAPAADPGSRPAPAAPAGGAVDAPAGKAPAATSSDADVADFVARMKSLAPATAAGRGRLIFAMDATMSREPTWDMALGLQAEMFRAVKDVGGLDVQLVFFRGMGECRASKWVSDPAALARLMTTVRCMGGHTQIGRVLGHARVETEAAKVRGDSQTIGFGSQIRSYVIHPYTMVKDLRTGYEVGNAQSVLDGDLDGFIRAELERRAKVSPGAS